MKDKKLARSITESDDRLKDIVNKVEKFSATDEIIGAYDLEKHRKMMIEAEKEEVRQEARNEGISQGINHEKKETAKNMLNDNVPIETISKYTGLSIEEINKLSEQI